MRFYRRFLPYGVAIVWTAIAMLLALWVEPLSFRTIGTFFYLAITVTTWYGGWRPGILALVLSTLAIDYFFFSPLHQLSIDRVENLLQVSFFLAVALTIVLLTSNLKENKKKIERLSQQLSEENAEQLRMALSAAQIGMWDWNIATGKIKWSPEHEQLFGLTPGKFDGRYETFDRFIHPDDRESLDRSLQQALQTYHIYQHEYRIIWPDGSIHWIEARGHGVYDAAGQPLGMTGTVINIDDRKRGEAERKQAEVLLHQQWEQQRTIVEISQRIRKSLNLAEILQTTVDEVRQLLQTSRVIIFQFAPNWSGTVVVESVGLEWTAILSTQIYDPCLGEKYVEPFQQGLVTAKSDIDTPEIDPCYVELLTNFQVKANLVVPILNGKELWGLLISHHCGEPRQWQPSEIELMQQVVTQVGIAIQQGELVEKLQIELQQRRQTEVALRDSEQKFRQLAENIEDVFFLYTADYSQILYINPAYETIWQQPRKSLYQNPFSFLDSIHPMDRDRVSLSLNRLVNGEADFEEEYRILRPDGSIRWIYDRGFFVYNEAGEPYRIAGLSTDITARKLAEIALQQLNAELEQRIAERTAELTQTNSLLQQELYQRQRIEQALRQSEAQFQNLVANVPGAIYRLVRSPDNSVWFEYISPAIKEMYEVEVEQILENASFVVNPIHPEDLAEHQAAISRSRENLEPFDNEWRIITPCGKLKWLHGRSIPERRDNGETVWYGIVQDISDRKRTEQALKQSEEKYRRIVDTANEGIWVIDDRGNTSFVNRGMAQMLGYSVPEMIGQSMFAFMDEQGQAIAAYYLEARRQGISEQHDFKFRCKDGSDLWCIIGNSPIFDETGQFLGALGMITDITDRKLTQELLQQSESTLRSFFNTAAIPMGIVELHNGDILHISDNWAAAQFFGKTIETMQNQFASTLGVPPATIERWIAYYQEAARTQAPVRFEYLHSTGDRECWLSGSVCPIAVSPSGYPRFSYIVEDITHRKQAEEALRQQANYEHLVAQIVNQIRRSLDLDEILAVTVTEVRQLLNADRVLIFQLHKDGSGSVVEESVLPEYPVTEKMRWLDECLPSDCYDFYCQGKPRIVPDVATDEWGSCLVEFMQEVGVKSKVVAPIVQTVEGSDRSRVWGLLIAQACSSYRQWQTIEADLLHRVTDQLAIAIQQSELYRKLQIELHERKQTEATLREAERRWRFLLDNVQLVVVGLDIAGVVNYVNPFLLKLTGYTESEALGKNWLETFLPDRNREEVEAVFSAVLAANAHPYYQNFIVTKSGEQRFIAWNNTLLRDSVGHIIGTVSIGEDITERQKIEHMKSEFISIVSHELRTPLTAIRASLGLLQTGIYDKKPDKLKRMIEIAAIDSERLVRLVNDILDLERLDSGRAVLEKTACKAIDSIRQAVEAVQAIADRQHIAFDIHPTDIEVWAASDAIVQTLINLLSNAVKFSPAGSTITVSVEPQIDRALFQVRDRGRGIPADKLEVIFGRFQQVDVSDSRDKGGTGLGLAICRSIIERHGGRIWAESSLGVGSTFFFTLLLRQEAQS
ncbi:PAS domain S-box protein [Aerosakkonema funiforme]|uniref:PAS domain S-box protein n=1 Tax=Aerosakkonema funiforme TaxID=1246630 RepID=UPI0035B9CE61